MTPMLALDDTRAVDLILDRGVAAQPAPAGTSSASTAFATGERFDPARVRGVERLLSLLDHLPPVDPPRDLVRRTLDYVAGRFDHDSAAAARIPVSVLSPLAQPNA